MVLSELLGPQYVREEIEGDKAIDNEYKSLINRR